MDKLRKTRSVQRTAFTKLYTNLNAELRKEERDDHRIEVMLNTLVEKSRILVEIDSSILDAMLEAKSSDAEFDKEVEEADDYTIKLESARLSVARILHAANDAVVPRIGGNGAERFVENSRKFKLPKIELKKFNGDPKEWLKFWSIFNKVHEDNDISEVEKFQYLLQAIVENFRASEFVNSYPPTAENYPKVIEGLKKRFGREDLLVEVYVRELLKLVLNKAKGALSSVYDKLETHLRALDSLGVTSAMCAAMLLPLVESSLPEEVLRTWQRQSNNSPDASARLEALMKFLGAEVEGEERISLAKLGFDAPSESATVDKTVRKANKLPTTNTQGGVATAAGLFVKEVKLTPCIFCQEQHESIYCEKAKQMSLSARQGIVKEKKACFACLKTNHNFQKCRAKIKCQWCGHKHAFIMCRQATENVKSNSPADSGKEAPTKIEENLAASCNNLACNSDVYLQTLRVRVSGPSGERIVRALIDTRSHKTYVLRSVADDLQLKIVGKQKMAHLLFGGEKTEPRVHNEYEFYLQALDGSYKCLVHAYQEEVICKDLPSVIPGAWIGELSSLGITLTDMKSHSEPIALLLGADIAGKLYTGQMHNIEKGPTAMKTKLGWTLIGRTVKDNVEREDATLTVLTMFTREAKISDLWELDVLGVMDPTVTESKEAHLAAVRNRFQQTIQVNEEGRYEVLLPWKDNHPPLPNNRKITEKRLHAITSKLRKERLYEAYEKVFNDWLQSGIIEEVSDTSNVSNGYFLPHRHVVKAGSTTPIRPVFDASAACDDGPSLNQCLETGPNLIELIPNNIVRFREHEIGVIADIAKAFLQMAVSPSDSDALKFLWWSKTTPHKVVVYRHRRVVFGVNSSPFLLGATIEYHLDKAIAAAKSLQERELLEKLKKAFYVDNCITSVQTEEERVLFQELATSVMQKACFDLRGWESSGTTDEQENVPVLGLCWNKKEDVIFMNYKFSDTLDEPVTKRKILSIAHKFFDPVGWTAPTLLQPKLMLQKLWSLKIGWEVAVPYDVERDFKDWYKQIPLLQTVRIPRWIFGSNTDQVSYHLFVDASKDAYAAVLFVRVETPTGVEVNLVQAKARVKPIKEVTIPRMELLAATLGARLVNSFSKAKVFPDSLLTCWTDSSTVLSWLRHRRQWTRFVFNRIEEIKSLTKVDAWRHVPGTQNPADLPSRGCTVAQLITSKWWEGPAWLKQPSYEWPQGFCENNEELVNSELKKTNAKVLPRHLNSLSTIVSENLACINFSDSSVPWYLTYFSNYNRVVRMVAWILRFAKNSRLKIHSRVSGDIDGSEFENAEKSVFKLVQQESFKGVSDPRLIGLNVKIDEFGLIRSSTLISNRVDEFGFRYPVVLDPDHKFTRLLIESVHIRAHHAGSNTTLRILRERVWILRSRRAVRSAINKCVTCRRYAAKPLETQIASLPLNRVKDASVFEVVGIDYAGPLYLRDQQKAWICLFTCAVYRCVHFELVSSLSTAGFLDAFRRFIARRGRPKIVYSDNGTNFVGANRLLRTVNWKKIASSSSVEKIDWRFNPPTAAWWGGWWERLVRILKDLLKRTLKKASLSYEEMNTILCDCESIVNSRPIAYMPDDKDGLLLALTPEMFLKDLREDQAPDIDCVEKTSLTRRLRYRQRLQRELRERFRSEYLGRLERKTRTSRNTDTVKVGDLVLIARDDKKRLNWPLARVIQMIPGRDGESRVAKVQTADGELVRPLQKLLLLEGAVVSNEDIVVSEPVISEENLQNDDEKFALDDSHDVSLRIDSEQKNDDVITKRRTRSGRISIPPKRLDL